MSITSPLLEIDKVRKDFGGLAAVRDLSFDVKSAQIKSLIGPNGAGKTTTINLICGVLPPSSGEVRFKGQNIKGLPVHKVASLGIGRTFQLLRLFKDMTVLENVMAGCHRWAHPGIIASGLRLPSTRTMEKSIEAKALSLVKFIGLGYRARQRAGDLPVGEQRILEVARALASDPELLLLDEPAAGLNDAERARLAQLLKELSGKGLAILLVEHNMDLVMSISDEIVVLNYGEKLAEGPPQEVRNHESVISAYLGEANHA